MENLSPEVLIILVTTVVSGIAIMIGTMIPTYMQGKAAEKALEGMARQPDAAPQLRTAMLIQWRLLKPRRFMFCWSFWCSYLRTR